MTLESRGQVAISTITTLFAFALTSRSLNSPAGTCQFHGTT